MGDLERELDGEGFEQHLRRSREVWDEICAMEEPIREALRKRAAQEIDIEKCEFLGKAMCNHLLKQRMIAIIKNYPVPTL